MTEASVRHIYLTFRGVFHNHDTIPGADYDADFEHRRWHEGDVIDAVAISEDGDFLAFAQGRTEAEAQAGLGWVGDANHAAYRAKYPEGFKLVWAPEHGHKGVRRALHVHERRARILARSRKPRHVAA